MTGADLTLSQRVERAVHRSLEQAGHFRGRMRPVHADDVRNALVAGFDVLRAELAGDAPGVPPAQPVVPVFHPGPFEVWIGLPGGGAAIRLDQGDDEHARRALPTEDDRARARVAIRDALRRLVRL